MTEIALATFITRATAIMLGALAAAGLRRTITVDPRVIYVWHDTRDYRRAAVLVISRRTGKVIRGGVTGAGPYRPLTGRALARAVEDFAWREARW